MVDAGVIRRAKIYFARARFIPGIGDFNVTLLPGAAEQGEESEGQQETEPWRHKTRQHYREHRAHAQVSPITSRSRSSRVRDEFSRNSFRENEWKFLHRSFRNPREIITASRPPVKIRGLFYR